MEIDSLDIFIKKVSVNRRAKKKKTTIPYQADVLAIFFTILANDDVTDKINEILRTTYLVPLRKEKRRELPPKKLRPLGIPSAIRQITAGAILYTYRSGFADYLLPFNFAFRVQGGIDVVTSTIRLAVEKYMTDKEARDELPRRMMVSLSLDIRNMFNAVSREKLREILSKDFPELEPLADCLYEEFGHTCMKKRDGTWEYIPVRERF